MWKMKMQNIALLFLVCTGVTSAYKSYAGYQVLSTAALSQDGLSQVVPLLRDSRFYFWSWPGVSRPALIMSPPEHLTELLELLRGLEPQVYINDVEKVFENERTSINNVKKREAFYGLQRNVTFDRYMEFDEIQAYLDEIVAIYPELASIETIGTSYEGRPLRVLKISLGGSPRPGVFIDAGIHAAEWLGPPTALYAIQQLTEFADQNQEMLNLADWYILPVANPDGYVFSWAEDRTWRKTRRPNVGSDCVGADPNRNFDVHWGEGGETDPCLWNYPGPNVYSEVESESIANYVSTKGQAGELNLYMALHTYGQFLLYPYGYSYDLPTQEVMTAAEEAIAAVEAVRGTPFVAGSISNVLYLAFGNSQDFAYDVGRVPFAYTWEMPAGGASGFDPPPSEIRPVVEETWQGFKVLVRHATTTK